MKKMLSAFVCVLVVATLFVGCADSPAEEAPDTGANYMPDQSTLDSIAGDSVASISEDPPEEIETGRDWYYLEEFSINEMIVMGMHFDSALIRMVGAEEFRQWRSETSEENQTVYKFIEDFGITDSELFEHLSSRAYEAIMLYWPGSDINNETPLNERVFPPHETVARGKFFDPMLIEMISGTESFRQWLMRTPIEERTVYRLIEDYGITNEELLQLHISVYEAIILYWPTS